MDTPPDGAMARAQAAGLRLDAHMASRGLGVSLWRGRIARSVGGVARSEVGISLHVSQTGISRAVSRQGGASFAVAPGAVTLVRHRRAGEWRVDAPAQALLCAATIDVPPAVLTTLRDDLADVWRRRLGDRVVATLPADGAIAGDVARLLADDLGDGLHALRVEAAAVGLVADSLGALLDAGSRSLPGPASHRAVRKAQERVLADLSAPVRLVTLARDIGISPSSLRQAFPRVTGASFSSWLAAARLDQARAMLLRGDRSVSEVGYAVGYAAPCNFATAFRRRFGEPPSACRTRR